MFKNMRARWLAYHDWKEKEMHFGELLKGLANSTHRAAGDLRTEHDRVVSAYERRIKNMKHECAVLEETVLKVGKDNDELRKECHATEESVGEDRREYWYVGPNHEMCLRDISPEHFPKGGFCVRLYTNKKSVEAHNIPKGGIMGISTALCDSLHRLLVDDI